MAHAWVRTLEIWQFGSVYDTIEEGGHRLASSYGNQVLSADILAGVIGEMARQG